MFKQQAPNHGSYATETWTRSGSNLSTPSLTKIIYSPCRLESGFNSATTSISCLKRTTWPTLHLLLFRAWEWCSSGSQLLCFYTLHDGNKRILSPKNLTNTTNFVLFLYLQRVYCFHKTNIVSTHENMFFIILCPEINSVLYNFTFTLSGTQLMRHNWLSVVSITFVTHPEICRIRFQIGSWERPLPGLNTKFNQLFIFRILTCFYFKWTSVKQILNTKWNHSNLKSNKIHLVHWLECVV